jgi:hypothetical protein
MTLLQLLPAILSALLLAAHFLRAGETALVAAALAALGLLFVRRPWPARLFQLLLLLGAVEWLRAMTALVAARQEFGRPYLRAALILGAVAVWTGASALLFLTPRLTRRFRLEEATGNGAEE